MQFHRGRLFDHVHLFVKDLEVSKRFYKAVLEVIGVPIGGEGNGWFWADELFVSHEGNDFVTERIHLAFQSPDRETVHRFYEAALSAGGRDNGAPGERSEYHPGYYAAYVLDPDGNNIEAVYHGSARRSAPSVVITAEV